VSALPASPLDVEPEVALEFLVSFLREEVAAAGSSRAVVGLSGGLDSAVVAALCVRAFGSAATLAVLLPYRTSTPSSEAHARLVANALGLATRRIDISAMVDGYVEQEHVAPVLRRGNVMARCRMTVLYDLSVEWRGLVIGTSNKTELLLGYCTLWGDAACAVDPLGDLYKHQVRQLARTLELPRELIEKPPSADLVPGQTDEAELGFTYEEADRVLFELVDERRRPAEVVARGTSRELVQRIVDRIVANQFKRLPPVIAKLSRRTVNQDFRYLRDWMK
jgi:NAD+ synthase